MQATLFYRNVTVLLIVICFAAACNCGECDAVVENISLQAEPAEDSFSLNTNNGKDVLYFSIKQQERGGDRTCGTKTFISCNASPVDTGSINISSDKALMYNGHTIAPQENIWLSTTYVSRSFKNTAGNPFYGSITLNASAAGGFQPGTYHFYFSVRTKDDKNFRDTSTIVYY